MNQLFIVFGILTAQSLSFPWARPYLWRYVMLVAVAIGVVQLLGSLVVVEPKESAAEQQDEEAPLLPAGESSQYHHSGDILRT